MIEKVSDINGDVSNDGNNDSSSGFHSVIQLSTKRNDKKITAINNNNDIKFIFIKINNEYNPSSSNNSFFYCLEKKNKYKFD